MFESIQRVGIYGVGLLGGSVGMALKDKYPHLQILGIGRNEKKLQKAAELQAIDVWSCHPEEINPALDLLILCTPVRLLGRFLRQTMPSLKPKAIVTDVGSTKVRIVRQCERVAGDEVRFVGSHPIAGSHQTGVEAATKDLLRGKVCVVTETRHSDAYAVDFIASLWENLGMKVVRMSPQNHDYMLANSSHLPHMVAAALCHVVKEVGKEIQPFLGSGYRDTTRIAAGDPVMWVDISMDNREELLTSLKAMRHVIQDLESFLQREDEEALLEFLQQAQDWKKDTG